MKEGNRLCDYSLDMNVVTSERLVSGLDLPEHEVPLCSSIILNSRTEPESMTREGNQLNNAFIVKLRIKKQ